MATSAEFVEFVASQIGLGDRMACKKMFGEFGLYVDGRLIALVCDNSLFIKPSRASSERTPALPAQAPYPDAKDYVLADELLDDPDALRQLIIATARLMPPPKPPKPRKDKVRAEP